MFWDKLKKKLKNRGFNVSIKEDDVKITEKDGKIYCPNCGSDQWYEGPSGGMAVNIKCANCGLWFNSTPFGLDFIGIKELAGESKKLRWYCPNCDTIEDVTKTSAIFKYPTCETCNTPLKVCWSYAEFPAKHCGKCSDRFKCYTERGNF